ncbi:MAG: sugar ABC transporter permease [Hungatella sp.]|jgi:ABC-type sugar transport system permease subunit|nr:sugar ABC transporter permease [Hungatella sp.]
MRRKQHYAWFFIFPGLILLLMFTVLAAILAFCFSFMDFNLLRPQDASFIGTDNYIRLFKDTSFLKAMKNTFYFAVIVVPYQVGLAFGLALLVRENVKGIGIFRSAYFSPLVTSMSVIAILWTFIYNPNPTQGLLNAVFAKAGLPSCDFLRSADTAMNSIIFMSGWHGAGYQMMILLAGLQAIPEDLYEAASIDGAGAIKKFVYITVPGIKNVLVFVVMMTTISAMKLFTQPYIMTNGGPKESTMTLTYYLYRQGFQYRNMGYASAVSVIFFVVVVGISTGIKKIMKAR